MVRNPVQGRSKEKKRKLIVAGMKLFSSKGYHDTSVTEIVDEAGISVGSFYSYFTDKKELLIQVSQAYGSSIIKGIYGNIADNAPVLESGKSIVTFIVESAVQAHTLSTELHREMLALKNREPEMAKLDKKITIAFEEGIESILKRCSEKVKVNDTKLSSKLVAGAIEETMHRCFLENQEEDHNLMFEELTEMCTGYLFLTSEP